MPAIPPEQDTLEVRPGRSPRTVQSLDGKTLNIPDTWDLLEPGDAALSRRIKKDGPSWTMKTQRRRRMVSLGIWAPAHRIEDLHNELIEERKDPAYQRKLDSGRARRAKAQDAYAEDFQAAVFSYLDFAPDYADLGLQLSRAISDHAVPVGSGTVARTQRIPIEQRAEAATIAWMRHQTTAYDSMTIPRVKGKRREVRRMLAKRSKELLQSYRDGRPAMKNCPLTAAING